MFEFKSFTGNALAITDAQIAADWRLGIVRGMARTVRNTGHAAEDRRDFTISEGSKKTAHVQGAYGKPALCAIVEVFGVDEGQETEYVRDSSGDYPENNTVIHGKVTCKCGQLVKQDFKVITYGGLLRRVANAS